MNIQEFRNKYSLFGTIVTSWNWAESNQLVLEIDLSNLNQADYQEDQSDFKSIILVFENCISIDKFDESFNGFSSGDARIIDVNYITETNSQYNKNGINLVMMHDKYDGADEKLISVVLLTETILVAESENKH